MRAYLVFSAIPFKIMGWSSRLSVFLLFLLTHAQAPIECPPEYNVTLAASEGANVVAVRRETSVVDNGNSNILTTLTYCNNSCQYITIVNVVCIIC